MPIRTLLKGEEGAALITALLLTSLALVISTALMYAVIMGSHVSATQKRYHSVLAATQGGVEALAREIVPYLMERSDSGTVAWTAVESHFTEIALKRGVATESCLTDKLNKATDHWGAGCSQTADPTDKPDLVFTLKGPSSSSGFTVFSKIVDTVPGNSDRYAKDLLDAGTSVAGNEEGIRPVHVPALFNITVFGQRQDSTREKAKLTVLYSY